MSLPLSSSPRGLVLSLINSLIFGFFSSGKRDLVARKVLVHPYSSGDFSVVSIDFKVQSLLVQWIRRLLVSPNGWIYLLTYWFLDRFNASPLDVFSNSRGFPASRLLPFYSSVLESWMALGGSSSASGLVLGGAASSGPLLVSSISFKACYKLFRDLNPVQPRCV